MSSNSRDQHDKGGAQPPSNRRRHPRRAADGPGRLEHRLAETRCELVNLSYGGARLTCPQGLVPRIGEPVRIGFLDGSTVVGRVTWLDKQEIGISFTGLVPDIHDRTDGTSDGIRLFTRIVSLQLDGQRS